MYYSEVHLPMQSLSGWQVDDMVTAMMKTGRQQEVGCVAGEHSTSGPDEWSVLSGGKSELSGTKSKKSPAFSL